MKAVSNLAIKRQEMRYYEWCEQGPSDGDESMLKAKEEDPVKQERLLRVMSVEGKLVKRKI